MEFNRMELLKEAALFGSLLYFGKELEDIAVVEKTLRDLIERAKEISINESWTDRIRFVHNYNILLSKMPANEYHNIHYRAGDGKHAIVIIYECLFFRLEFFAYLAVLAFVRQSKQKISSLFAVKNELHGSETLASFFSDFQGAMFIDAKLISSAHVSVVGFNTEVEEENLPYVIAAMLCLSTDWKSTHKLEVLSLKLPEISQWFLGIDHPEKSRTSLTGKIFTERILELKARASNYWLYISEDYIRGLACIDFRIRIFEEVGWCTWNREVVSWRFLSRRF
jgi:hypothetical protein